MQDADKPHTMGYRIETGPVCSVLLHFCHGADSLCVRDDEGWYCCYCYDPVPEEMEFVAELAHCRRYTDMAYTTHERREK